MTTRTVFVSSENKPFYRRVPVEFDFHVGLSLLQKKKNVKALHEAFQKEKPGMKVLEVSTKSEEDHGRSLSPFFLKRTLHSLKKEFPVENIVQASKVVEQGGPYYDLLGAEPAQAKRDPRTAGECLAYELEGNTYPSRPDFLFYTWIYAMAVMENNLSKDIMPYEAFTDIEFAGADGNCQARACAITRSLLMQGKLKKEMSFDDFSRLFLVMPLDEVQVKVKKDLRLSAPVKKTVFSVGDWIQHPTIGQGQIMKKTPRDYTVMFRVSGPRTLRKDIVETRCRKI